MKLSMSRTGICWEYWKNSGATFPAPKVRGRAHVTTRERKAGGVTFATQRDALHQIVDWLTLYNQSDFTRNGARSAQRNRSTVRCVEQLQGLSIIPYGMYS